MRWSITKNAPTPPLNKKSLYSDPNYRIADFFCSVRLASPIIAVSSSSNSASSHWKLAGYLTKALDTGIVLGNSFDSLEENQKFWLNQSTLFFFKQTSTAYGVKFSIPYWIRNIRVTVFEYTGPIEDSIEQKLDQIQTSINQIISP